ncbi:MAG: hypothetical protein DRP42_06765 [Tenericutes bacterium]|nr:MAG: hypothetical protein DRP42_06765 [Mycoplasmatota bacterium]
MFNLLSPKKSIQDKPKKKNAVLKPGRIRRVGYPGSVYNVSPAYGNLAIGKRGVFQKSEYDLGEVARVMDIEAYVRQAFNKHIELCMKEGYQIKSRNPEATRYVKRRLREIGESTGRTFDSLLRGILSNMVSFSNCFVVKVRDFQASSGEYRLDPKGERLSPVAGYFLLDPTTMEIKRNIHGKVFGYLQRMPGVGVYPKFKPYDMVHMVYNRKEGFAFGTPYIIPCLDDIRSLRRMEENIEMLTLAHLYPLFQYIVGTEDHPAEVYEDGTTEVDLIKTEIENMPTEGSIVTPERHEIKAIGAEGKALDATEYLKHFEMRVLAGLGISEIALGRGGTANRNTAAVIDKGMVDRCKDFQDVTEGFVNEYMFKELLLEGKFQIDEKEENIVTLEFNEIDIDSQIKLENHSVFKYEHDAITEPEMRGLLGKDPITEEERNEMFFEVITKPRSIIMAVDEPYTAEAKANGAVAKVSKEEKKKKNTNNREQPANQHGKKMAKTTTKQDSPEEASREKLLKESLEDIKKITLSDKLPEIVAEDPKGPELAEGYSPRFVDKMIVDLIHYWDITREDVFDYVKQTYIEENKSFRDFTPDKLKMILFLTKDSIVRKSGLYVFKAFKDGIDKAETDSGIEKISLSVDPTIKHKYLEERIDLYTTGLLSDLGAQLVRKLNPEFSDNAEDRKSIIPTIAGVFDTLKYRIKFTAHTEIMKSYNFGYALAMRELGYKDLYLKLDANHCSKCEEASKKALSLEYFSFEDVAPIHPMCNCTYSIRKD